MNNAVDWDYIIVGAGSAGCAAAYELIETGNCVVLKPSEMSSSSAIHLAQLGLPIAARPEPQWG